MPLTIKLSDEQLSKLGVKTAEEAIALLEKSKEPPKAEEPKDSVAKLTIGDYDVTTRFNAIENRLKALEDQPRVKPEDLAAVKSDARTEAVREAMAVIAKIGGAALTTKEKPADVATEKTAEEKAKEAGDYKAQWKASEKLQEEFSTAESYEAYMKAAARGQVHIQQRG